MFILLTGTFLLYFPPNVQGKNAIGYFDNDYPNQCIDLKTKDLSGDSGLLISHRAYERHSYTGSLSCVVNIFAKSGYKVRLRILDFDVGTDGGAHHQCPGDILYVFDRGGESKPEDIRNEVTKNARILTEYCGKIEKKAAEQINSSNNTMSLWWTTNHGVPRGGKGFKMLWTAFRNLNKGEKCGEKEFACASSECISSDLVCDKQPNCLDGSDENRLICGGSNEPLTGWALLLTCFVAVFVFLSCIICACRLGRCFRPSRKEFFDTIEKKPCCAIEVAKQPLPPSFFPPQPPRLVPSLASTNFKSVEHHYTINPCSLRYSSDRRWPNTRRDVLSTSGYNWKDSTRLSNDSEYAYVRNDFRRLIA